MVTVTVRGCAIAIGDPNSQQGGVVDGGDGGLDDQIGDGDIFAAQGPHRRADDAVTVCLGYPDVEIVNAGGDIQQGRPGEAGCGRLDTAPPPRPGR